MNFGTALDILLRNMNKNMDTQIRRKQWLPYVFVGLQKPDEHNHMTAPYLYVESLKGRIPWIPNMIEICAADDWMVIV